jgi:hypothetical protein
MAVWQILVPLVNIKIAGKWMFISLKMVLIGIDPSLMFVHCTVVLSENQDLQLSDWLVQHRILGR